MVCLSLLQVDLPNPGIKPGSLALQVYSLPAELPGKVQTYNGIFSSVQFSSVQSLSCVRLFATP